MRISTKASYGLNALFDLAFHCEGRPAQAREIAARQQIPLRYLEQILQDLRRARIVDAKRGPRGGYLLARTPEAVRLLDVVAAVDGAFDPLIAAAPPLRPRRSRAAGPPHLVWRELGAKIEALCAGLTLKDFVDRAAAQGLPRVEATAPLS